MPQRTSDELAAEAKARGVPVSLLFAERAMEISIDSRRRLEEHEARCDERNAVAAASLKRLEDDMRERLVELRREVTAGVSEIREGQKALFNRTFQMVLALAGGLAAALIAAVSIIKG